MKSNHSRKESKHHHNRSNAGASGTASLFGRRKGVGMDFLSDFKNDLDTTKDIYQLIREQLLSDPQSPWKGSELLYVVIINRRRKATNTQSTMSSTDTSGSHSFALKQERFLVLLKNPDSATGFHLIRVIKKENELEYKSSVQLSEVKSLDYGADDMELLVCEDAVDHSVFFNSAGERDETLWILMQVCRLVSGAEVSIGYSVDVDGLQYLIANCGIFTRFPQLEKVISLNSSHVHDQFTADETEAEHILDEINWGSSLSGQRDLQSMLSQRSDKLNNEIIDFLLQWEEMDEAAEAHQKSKKSAGGDQGPAAVAAASSSSAKPSSMMNLRDTREVLTALSLVDDELRAVETWLGDQIKRLSSIRGNLSLIEEESGGLETSWQNLNVVEEVIALLVEKYSFEDAEEALLRSPDMVVSNALKSPTLSTLEKSLQPLVAAGQKLRNALIVKLSEMHGISAADWKQVQAIAAISTRKEQLMAIADTFCSKFGEVTLSLFDKILKHRAMQEGDVFLGSGSSKSHSQSHIVTLIPKTFSNKSLFEQVSFATIWLDISRYFSIKTNALLECQALYQSHLDKFSTLLDLQAELASASSRALCEAYMRATSERFATPLIKAFSKDLQSLVNLKQAPIGFQTAARYRIGTTNELTIYFHQANNRAGQAKLLTSWKALEVALIMLSPFIATEEQFIKKLFHLDGRKVDSADSVTQNVSLVIDEATFGQSRLHNMLDTIFEAAADRLLGLTSSQQNALSGGHELVDGIESVAMLTTVAQYADHYKEAIQPSETDPDPTALAFSSSSMYLFKFFKTLQLQLEHRITAFTTEQIQWITSQRADTKSPDVLLPFVRFPFVVMHVLQMTNGKTFDCVDELLVKLARELLSWLAMVSKQNEKYVDKVKLTNLVFLHLSLSELKVPCLEQFMAYSQQQILEASTRYVNWMVEYEFPALSALAVRIDGVGRKVDSEDLALYIRRKDVLSVIKELDSKSLDSLVSTMAKRIEKHFKSENDAEMGLLSQMWTRLKERIVGIVTKLEVAASISYQIELEVKPTQLLQLFDKYAATF